MTELENLMLQIEMEDINNKLDFISNELDNNPTPYEREQYKRATRTLEIRYKQLENKLWKEQENEWKKTR